MAFEDFLYNYFPHRWLNKKAEGTKRLFGGLAKSLDYTYANVECLVRNLSTRTAVELLSDLENEYGIDIDPSAEIEKRRAKIIAKKRVLDCPITKPNLINMFKALGVTVQIENFYNDHLMKFFISSNEFNISYVEINEILIENIRAHVAFKAETEVAPEHTASAQYHGNALFVKQTMILGAPTFESGIYSTMYRANTLFIKGYITLGGFPAQTVINGKSHHANLLTMQGGMKFGR